MRIRLLIATFLISALTLPAQDYTWEAGYLDGSMTGCTAPSKDNVSEALGEFKGGRYIAPNGRVFGKRTAVARTARVMLDAQPAMSRVKDVIAYSPCAMEKEYPEGALTNWFVDIIMDKTEELAGKKVDIGVANFGGVRVDMPQGDVILDDMLSMFPFKNNLIYVEHKGSTLRKMIEDMAATRFQVLGGVRIVVEDGKVVVAEISGEPIDDDKVYGLATVSFLLHGGDGLYLADKAVSLTSYDVNVIDAVLEHVMAETAAGRPIVASKDGRVIIKD